MLETLAKWVLMCSEWGDLVIVILMMMKFYELGEMVDLEACFSTMIVLDEILYYHHYRLSCLCYHSLSYYQTW